MAQQLNFIEEKEIIITPTSPIHISNGDFLLSAADIKIRNNDGTEDLLILNEELLAERMKETSAIRDYVKFIKYIDELKITKDNKKLPAQPLDNFIFNKKHINEYIKNNALQTFIEARLRITDIPKWIKDNKLISYKIKIYSKNQFIKDGSGRSYIPGTSIKGAIRTAIIWKMLKTNVGYNLENEILEYYYSCLNKYTKYENNEWKRLLSSLDRANQNIISNCYDNSDTGKLLKRDLTITDVIKLATIFSKELNKRKLHYPFEAFDAFIFEDYPLIATATKSGRTFDLPQNFNNWKSALANFMKTLQVTDSSYFEAENGTAKTFSINNDQFIEKDNTRIQKEVFNNGSVKFKISLHLDTLNKFNIRSNDYGFEIPFNTLQDLIKIVGEFYSEVWREEKEFFLGDKSKAIDQAFTGNTASFQDTLNFYNRADNLPNFRIGWGSGLLGVTVFTLLSKDYRKAIRNLIKPKGNVVAPKSRRLVTMDGKTLPLGWGKLT